MSELTSIEVTGPDVEAAVAKGIESLGVSRDEVMVEVLEEPSRRLLGLGSRLARVRLTVIRAPQTPAPPVSAPPPDEIIVPAPAESRARPAPKTPKAVPGRAGKEPKEPTAAKASQVAEAPAIPEPAETEGAAPTRESAPAASFEDFEEEGGEAHGAPTDEDLAAEARTGADILRTILGHLGLNAQVAAKKAETDGREPRHWMLEVTGQELGSLIGRKGETLAALQYLTRIMVSRQIGRRAHLVVDVEGYKTRRETMLKRLAIRMAEQAVQRGRPVAMEPMPPHERRIIHLALRNHPDVTTESVGEGDRRKVTVVPRRPKEGDGE